MIEDNKIESIVCDIYNYQTSLTSLTPNSNSVTHVFQNHN